MLIPSVVDPRDLLNRSPKGSTFDGERKIKCICGTNVCLGNVKLAWVYSTTEEEYGFFAFCDFRCFTAKIVEGNA